MNQKMRNDQIQIDHAGFASEYTARSPELPGFFHFEHELSESESEFTR